MPASESRKRKLEALLGSKKASLKEWASKYFPALALICSVVICPVVDPADLDPIPEGMLHGTWMVDYEEVMKGGWWIMRR